MKFQIFKSRHSFVLDKTLTETPLFHKSHVEICCSGVGFDVHDYEGRARDFTKLIAQSLCVENMQVQGYSYRLILTQYIGEVESDIDLRCEPLHLEGM